MWNKLVRDRIIEIIEADNKVAIWRSLDEAEFRVALLEKLIEESREVATAPPEELGAELADVLEVLYSICDLVGLTVSDLERVRQERARVRGRFIKRIWLVETRSTDRKK